jgi:hypothetical protein
MIYEMFVNNLRGQFVIYMCVFLCKLEDRKCNRYYLVKTFFFNQFFKTLMFIICCIYDPCESSNIIYIRNNLKEILECIWKVSYQVEFRWCGVVSCKILD